MTHLYSVAQIREIEAAHFKAHPKTSLMQRAGEAVATLAIDLITKHKLKKSVLIIAGTGNNGGDAWVAARALQIQKIKVCVWQIGAQKNGDAASKKAHEAYIAAKGNIALNTSPALEFGLIIDGIFGIGLSKAPTGDFRDAIRFANQQREKFGTRILAIDIPSGLSADTGVAFADTINADATITFLGAKPGLYTADGTDHCGKIFINSLDVDSGESNGSLLTEHDMAELIIPRRNNSHKGTCGNVGIIGGASGMVGAAVLAARAALHMGPGKVYAGLIATDAMTFDAINPEIMVRRAADVADDKNITAFAIGMGAGEGKPVKALLAEILALSLVTNKPVLIDADALAFVNIDNANSSTGVLNEAKMAENTRPALSLNNNIILTPHPGEAARLLKITTAGVEADRINAALSIAKRASAIVVLKGAGTVIATPEGSYFINITGNPGMASGGMGDALSGMIAAFLALGLTPLNAAKLGVYLHGAAADCAAHHGMGPNGLTASEVIFEARTLLNTGLHDEHDHED
jgi:ADP-dependent NAD(P)H-hydrate dehydratase / NAD(P)H-hydrate epimerase